MVGRRCLRALLPVVDSLLRVTSFRVEWLGFEIDTSGPVGVFLKAPVLGQLFAYLEETSHWATWTKINGCGGRSRTLRLGRLQVIMDRPQGSRQGAQVGTQAVEVETQVIAG